MTHPVELAASRAIADLRLDHWPRNEEDALHLADGVYFSWDAANGDVTVDVKPELGALMHLSTSVRKAPGWLTFNIGLGEGVLAAGDVLGMVVEFAGLGGEELPMFIRSARGEALADTWLQDKLMGTENRGVQTLLHQVAPDDPLSDGTGFHTLVLPLPKRDFTLELRDMRIFVIPAARGLQLAPATVAQT